MRLTQRNLTAAYTNPPSSNYTIRLCRLKMQLLYAWFAASTETRVNPLAPTVISIKFLLILSVHENTFRSEERDQGK